MEMTVRRTDRPEGEGRQRRKAKVTGVQPCNDTNIFNHVAFLSQQEMPSPPLCEQWRTLSVRYLAVLVSPSSS